MKNRKTKNKIKKTKNKIKKTKNKIRKTKNNDILKGGVNNQNESFFLPRNMDPIIPLIEAIENSYKIQSPAGGEKNCDTYKKRILEYFLKINDEHKIKLDSLRRVYGIR